MMFKKVFILLFLCSNLSTMAQNADRSKSEEKDEVKTLLGKGTRIGAYLSLEGQFTNLKGFGPAVFSGARLGMVVNRNLFFGIGAYGHSTDFSLSAIDNDNNYHFDVGHSGLSLEPILFAKKMLNLSFPLYAGVGYSEIDERFTNNGQFDSDAFWIYRGGAELQLNITKWCRLAGGIHYTQTDQFNLQFVDTNLLNGLYSSLSLKLGRF